MFSSQRVSGRIKQPRTPRTWAEDNLRNYQVILIHDTLLLEHQFRAAS